MIESPYDELPPPLVEKLLESFDARRAGVPGAEQSLAGIWGKRTDADDVWDLVDRAMDWQDVNTMVRVHQRIMAVDTTGELWGRHVRYLVRAYTGGVYALEVVYRDRDELRTYLDEDVIRRTDPPLLARGARFTQCRHRNTDGWREVSETDSLHIDVANVDDYPGAEDIHIDETSFTSGRDEKGMSRQAWASGPRHFAQSELKWIDVARPFTRLEALLGRPSEERPRMKAETEAALQRWAEIRGHEAVAGEAGHRRALALWRRIQSGG